MNLQTVVRADAAGSAATEPVPTSDCHSLRVGEAPLQRADAGHAAVLGQCDCAVSATVDESFDVFTRHGKCGACHGADRVADESV
jgi:hypothetical protein